MTNKCVKHIAKTSNSKANNGVDNEIKAIYKGYNIVSHPECGEYRVILKNEVAFFESIQEAKEYIKATESSYESRKLQQKRHHRVRFGTYW